MSNESTTTTRNFCIIAHIDHGKSTLADRFLEFTGTVSKRDMQNQLLDSMDLERERGITIKLTPVRMEYEFQHQKYTLNLIDTPGHVDFTYEVSRSLAAVEGAILLVDATQGVQAQTIGNLYLALEQNLTIIPVINKIDMPIANVEKTKAEIIHLLGCKEEEIILASGKTGQGIPDILEAIIKRIAAPPDTSNQPLRALIFDSSFNEYKGVVASIRIVDGTLKKGEKIYLLSTHTKAEVLETGFYTPKFHPTNSLENGQIGYVTTGLKEVRDCRVGDTITLYSDEKNYPTALPGYKEVKPMVFAGIFPKEGDAYQELRDAIDKLKLNDAALIYEPEHSQALGYGFRCGFLGMLHLDIFQERLKREHGIEVIITTPSVAYKIIKSNNEEIMIKSPQEMPDPASIKQIFEPIMKLDIITPKDYVGNVMGLISERRGEYLTTEYLSTGTDQRALLHYKIPLASLITDFYDKLKTVTSGYASMNYEYEGFKATDIIRLDILVADEPVEALATLVWREDAYHVGKKIVESLKESLPRQQFELKIQATIGGKVIAADRLSALRKDVTAKLYGGDVTRKMKLLQKQKKGKKKMMAMGKGKVDIPSEAYLAVLKR
jgi:GTP-binding protein LepA